MVCRVKILFCSGEVAPFAKTGGLADVAGSLPLALGKLGIDVLILMPKYRGIEVSEKILSDRVRVRFIEHEAFFNRSGLYGNRESDYTDNLDRFTFFSYECLAEAKRLGFKPDVVHAHDWHAALIPVLLKTKFAKDDFYKGSKTVLTIHNLAYQGVFAPSEYKKLGLPQDLFSVDGFEFYGQVNVLKAGLLFADRLNAVSPSYATEIQTQEFGCGLEGVLQKRKRRLSGILNGIDTEAWNPATDAKIKTFYSAGSLEGKKKCKRALQEKCGFEADPEIPVLAIVSRLTHQKGLDLLAKAVPHFFKKKFQFVVLGDGEAEYRRLFEDIEKKYPGKAKIFFGFRAAEAHTIYAGADLFLMPSLFEPCGLGQLISMRYGTIPVVRRTGGLKDTVIDADEHPKKGNGFTFEGLEVTNFIKALDRAEKAFEDKKRWDALVQSAMKSDFSWDESAKKYESLYREAL